MMRWKCGPTFPQPSRYRAIKVVVGDVSADGTTLLNDFALTKLRAQVVPFAVDPGNLADIRKDISNDGQIVLNDVALTKLNQGNGRILTCP
jgi:hypothetical protein